VSFWIDPDIGGRSDDLAGWDSTLQMGYVYNATNTDNVYGARAPAIGIRHLGGSTGNDAGAFAVYINGSDPSSPIESYRLQRGTRANGDAWIDPDTQQASVFPYDGDPVTGTGWLDGPQTADRKIVVTTRWFPLAPGDFVNFVFALAVGQGIDRLDSIERLRCQARLARLSADHGFAPIFPSGLRLVTAQATSSGVHVAWNAPPLEARPLELRRQAGGALDPWPEDDEPLGQFWPDANGNLAYDGPALAPGERFNYGLFDPCDPLAPISTATLEGPGGTLSLHAVSPTTGALGLAFVLPAAGPARVEAFAVDGRRMLARDLGTLDYGAHSIVLPESAIWPTGLYFLRLRHGAGTVHTRAVLVH
jgi:hypothetical protein